MEKEPSFVIGIGHNFPHCFSPSQGIIEVLIGLVLFCSGLRDFFFLITMYLLLYNSVHIGSFGIHSYMSNPADRMQR